MWPGHVISVLRELLQHKGTSTWRFEPFSVVLNNNNDANIVPPEWMAAAIDNNICFFWIIITSTAKLVRVCSNDERIAYPI